MSRLGLTHELRISVPIDARKQSQTRLTQKLSQPLIPLCRASRYNGAAAFRGKLTRKQSQTRLTQKLSQPLIPLCRASRYNGAAAFRGKLKSENVPWENTQRAGFSAIVVRFVFWSFCVSPIKVLFSGNECVSTIDILKNYLARLRDYFEQLLKFLNSS